jgi:hypothetical protein
MKILMLCLSLGVGAYAQTPINKTIPVKTGQKISMRFDYPELIKVSTWDKNEVSVQGSVSINNGENDDAFELITSESGGTITIKNEIRNMKDIPHRITIRDGSEKIVFRNKDEYKKYASEKGRHYDRMNYGIDIEIIIEIKVPRNVDTRVESVYGMVEVKDFVGPLTVEATYGGVDAALTEKSVGEIAAETNYGEIFSNLDVKFNGEASKQGNFHTYVLAKPGTGPQYSFDSKYGNVYLRKAN